MNGISGQLMLFSAGVWRCAVPIGEVAEVIELPALYPIPGAAAVLRGAINSHGRLLPLVDLSLLCGMESGSASAGKVIVFDNFIADMALLVDDMHEVRSSGDILEEDEGEVPCLTRQFMFADGVAHLVTCQGVLAAVERLLAESRSMVATCDGVATEA